MYRGQWKNDMQWGIGRWTLKKGDVIEGTFVKGSIDGEVIIRYSDGSKFKGQYKKGKRNGPAIEEDKNGNRFEGTYINDRRDGKFIEKDRNGKITARGHYDSGRRFTD